MAKTIKFNLTCDGASVRTLEDLREHFCVQDILGYFESGLLARWLKVHGYEDELKALTQVKEDESTESKMKELATIFQVVNKETEISESLRFLKYDAQNNQKYETYASGKCAEKKVLASYKERYDGLINDIIEHKDDYGTIKSVVDVLVKDFSWMIEIDFERLFYQMLDNAPMALYYFVTKDELRKFCLPIKIKKDDGTFTYDTQKRNEDCPEKRYYAHKLSMYDELKSLTSVSSMEKILGDKLKTFSNNTEDYWKDIEPDANKKFLILSMPNDCIVRSLGNKGEELRAADINCEFIILNGIDFKNKYNNKIYYMEV